MMRSTRSAKRKKPMPSDEPGADSSASAPAVSTPAAPTEPSPFVGPFAGRIVTIRVGLPPAGFTVHEDVLKANESRFFQVAFNNGFEETQTGLLELPEDDAQAFRVFLHWAYANVANYNNANCARKEFFQDMDKNTLIKLYVLASKYTMDTLHDAIITHLWWKYDTSICCLQMSFSKDALSYFEENTIVNCHLDKLLVDWMTDDALSCTRCKDVDRSVFDAMPDRLARAAFVKAHRAFSRTAATYRCGYCTSSSVLMQTDGISNTCGNCSRANCLVSASAAAAKQKGDLCSYHCHRADQPCTAPRYLHN